jgi:hypothetical protein
MSAITKSFSTIYNASTAEITSTILNIENLLEVAVQVTSTPSTPSAKNYLAGESAIETLTFLTKANTVDGDYVVVFDSTGTAWAIAADATGSSAVPTGAVWLAIPAANKAQADISAATSAADVAAAFELAFDALTGFTAVIVSDDTAADGTMTMTTTIRGPVTASDPQAEDDATAGTITAASTNVGVASTVDVTANTITIAAHGLATGLKGQFTTTGTLPAGISLATDYFVIAVDANTISIATSLALATAGTAVDITDQGADGNTHTFTATTSTGNVCKLQESIDGVTYVDLSGLTVTIATSTATTMWKPNALARYINVLYTPSAGQCILKVDVAQTIRR